MTSEAKGLPMKHIFIQVNDTNGRRYTIEIPKQPVSIHRMRKVCAYISSLREFSSGRLTCDDILGYIRMQGIECHKKYDFKVMYLSPRQQSKIGEYKKNDAMDMILRVVCDYYQVKHEDVRGKARTPKSLMKARKMFCYMTRSRYPKADLHEISNFVNVKTHSTALHHYEDVKNLLEMEDKNVMHDEYELDRMIDLELIASGEINDGDDKAYNILLKEKEK